MTGARLTVAVVLDRDPGPTWAAELLRELETSDIAEVGIVVELATAAERSPSDRVMQAFARTDRRRAPRSTDPDQPWTGEPIPAGVPRIGAMDDWSGDIASLDVVLDLSRSGCDARSAATLASRARFGLWRLQVGHGARAHYGLEGVAEVLLGEPFTEAAVCVRLPQPVGDTIAIGYLATATVTASATHSRVNIFRRGARLLRDRLRELRDTGVLPQREPAGELLLQQGAPLSGLGALRGAYLRGAFWWRRQMQRVRGRLTRGQWQLAFRHAGDDGSEGGWVGQRDARVLVPPPDRFWADPFPVVAAGRHYLFFEELQYADHRGYLMVVSIGTEGMETAPVRILGDVTHHLSWPFVFQWAGEWYLMPESQLTGQVHVYRATRFPYEWEPANVVLRDPVVDPCVVEYAGRWWLFACGAPAGEPPCDDLYVYHGPSPLGPWTPHRRNPVKRDVRSSRPAGRPFERDGTLYRPTQDCSARYGWRVSLCRIDRLDTEEYREEVVSILGPDVAAGALGVHTLNCCEGISVIDIEVSRWQLSIAQ